MTSVETIQKNLVGIGVFLHAGPKSGLWMRPFVRLLGRCSRPDVRPPRRKTI